MQRILRKTKIHSNGCIEYTGTSVNKKERQVSFKGKMIPAARLVYILEKGEIPKGMIVCHKCDFPACVNINHLFLGTNKDNSIDASRKFRLTHGERHWSAKLSESDVLKMREFYSTGFWSYASLARKFGINESTSARIIKGRLWKHLLKA